MKKIMSVILLLSVLISCFTISTSAVCYHRYSTRYKYTAYSTYHIRIECLVCSTCGDTIEVSRQQQSHFDATGDKKCDQCGSYMSSSSPSTPSTPTSCSHSYEYHSTDYFPSALGGHETQTTYYCAKCYSYKYDTVTEQHIDKDHDGCCDSCEVRYNKNYSHYGDTFAYFEYKYIDNSEKHHVVKYCICTGCKEAYAKNEYDEYHKDNDKDSKCDLCELEVEHKNHYDTNKDDECDFCDYIMRTYEITQNYSVNYKEKAAFKVVSNNLPSGASIALYSFTDQETPLAISSEGNVEWMTDALTAREIYVVKIIDENGDPILTSTKVELCYITINVEDSFFIRIIAFFRSLFGAYKVNMVGTYQFDY